MSVATKRIQSSTKQPRAVLGSAGNRVRILEECRRKTEVLKKSKKPVVSEMLQTAVKHNLSVDSSCSSDSNSSCFSSSSTSSGSLSQISIVKRNGLGSVKVVPDSGDFALKRCDWITSNSDPLYMSFHDEEWGVPVHDDIKLFELLVYSQALAEMNWPAILNKRDIFRKLFDNFEPSSVAQFTEKKLSSLKFNGNLLLSEPKFRAIVENAKLILQIQQEFGSFNNYCWRFVNDKPLRKGFRYSRQIPVKTPKAELISKDLMQRGFRCVGPTVVYSFMQVAGIVNDHLSTCFRYDECNANVKKNCEPSDDGSERVAKALENTCLSQ